MKQRTFNTVAGVIFLVIAVGHLVRIFGGFTAAVEGVEISLWLSWVAVVVAGLLACAAYRLNKK